jgi:predicted SAM-dependent methyltransferase
MKYLNLGCGHNYSSNPEWVNLDFSSTGNDVIAYNLLDGVPFETNYFDIVYHSHVLEHFNQKDGEIFIRECFRVLKPGGILRVAIPDLEAIARNYLRFLEEGFQNLNDEQINANYQWIMLELFDQTIRNERGGEMGKYLQKPQMLNEEFVFSRIGEEGKLFRKEYLTTKQNTLDLTVKVSNKEKLKNKLYKLLGINKDAMKIGNFRLSGEIHQWMYDRYSLTKLLMNSGGNEIIIRSAFESYITNWSDYNLDGVNGVTRKPDSLFIEAIKK